MYNSGIDSPIPIIKNRAAGYSKDRTGFINAPLLTWHGLPVQGPLYSTTDDMYRWHCALQNAKIAFKRIP